MFFCFPPTFGPAITFNTLDSDSLLLISLNDGIHLSLAYTWWTEYGWSKRAVKKNCVSACLFAFSFIETKKKKSIFLKGWKKLCFSSFLYTIPLLLSLYMIQTFHFQQVCQKTNIIHKRRDKFSIIYLKCSSRCVVVFVSYSSTNKRNYSYTLVLLISRIFSYYT